MEFNVRRMIPMDLFPYNRNEYNMEWAKRQFRYCHLFVQSINYEAYRNNEDLELWRKHALDIRLALANYGKCQCESQLVDIVVNRFDVSIEGHDNIRPTTLKDVLKIYGTKSFYRNNVDLRRDQLYHLMYGSFNNGNNDWALESEVKKLREYNLSYMVNFDDSGDKNRTRGCIYQLMTKNISQTIKRKFKQMMKTKHSEYIIQRNKLPKEMKDAYEKIECRGNEAYLVTCKQENDIESETNNNNVILKEQAKQWIMSCKREGMENTKINAIITNWCTKYDKEMEGKFLFKRYLIKQKSIKHNLCHFT